MHLTTLGHLLRNVKSYTNWQKRTKHSLTIVGNLHQTNKLFRYRKEMFRWLASSPCKRNVKSGLWHILMLVRIQQLNVRFSIQDVFIKSEKRTKVLLKLTG